MKKFFNCLRKYSSFFAALAAIVSAFSALYSGYLVNEANKFNKEINKAAISIIPSDITFSRMYPDTMLIVFGVDFKNTGNEPFIVNKISTSLYDFKTKEFSMLLDVDAFMNIVTPSIIFSPTIEKKISLPNISITTKEFQKSFINDIDYCLMIRIDYSSQHLSDYNIYYVRYYKGLFARFLSLSEYEIMKDSLPPIFNLDMNRKDFKQTKETN